jgi:hypothetical protein
VKTFILNRNGEKETMDEYRNHIEKTERINEFFIRNGINGAMPVSFDHSYTHLYQGKLYVAYQWIDFLPLRKNNKDCYRAGDLLSKLHGIKSIEETLSERTTEIDLDCYREMLMHFSSSLLSQITINTLLDLAKEGVSSYNRTQNIRVLSHGDIHFGNIKQNHSKELLLLDWEHAGCYHPGIELFDAALGLCGYMQLQTNLSLFDSVISGYYESRHPLFYVDEIPIIVGSMYYYESEYIYNMIQTLAFVPSNAIKVTDHIKKILELKKYFSSFVDIMKYRYFDIEKMK